MEKPRFKLNLQLFAEDEEQEEQEEQVIVDEDNSLADIIEKQKKLLDDSVRKKDFDKLKAENEKLTKIIIDGGALPGDEEEIEEVDIDKLAKHIFNPSNQDSNLEFISKTLKYRAAVLKQKGYDVFVPQDGSKFQATDNDIATAERVADVLQQCVDESGGDSGVFTAMLQSRIKDDPITKRGPIKRR